MSFFEVFLLWFVFVRIARIVYFGVGRTFGFAGISQYGVWTDFLLAVPWRGPHKLWMVSVRFIRQKLYHLGPSQRWAGFWEIASNVYRRDDGSIPVGRLAFSERFPLHMPVGLPDGEKHVAYIAYAGGGKSSQIATWLGCLQDSASAFVFDMDGAFVNAFGAALQNAGHKVVKIDPDNLAKGFDIPGGFDPMNELTVAANRHGNAAVVAFAQTLSNALIVQDSQTQPVFANLARVFLTGLILYVWLVEQDKSLMRVRSLLTQGLSKEPESSEDSESLEPFEALLLEMRVLPGRFKDRNIDDGCNGEICEAIANCSGLMSDQSSSGKQDSFRSTAIYQTAWIDDPNVRRILRSSDVCGEELKLSNTVVFMVSTLQDTQTRLAPFVRSFTLLTLYAFQKTEPEKKLKYPCLFVLDEFPNLGRMETVATAAPGFRKYGVRLVTVSQSIGLLRKTYPEEHREFLNQAQCVIWMGISQTDTETLAYLSGDVLGECMRKERVDGYHWLARLLTLGLLPRGRYQRVPRLLMTPQQCAAFLDRSTGQIIVTREGRSPMRMQRLRYWKDLSVWQYAVHKGHGETDLRAFTRKQVNKLIAWRVGEKLGEAALSLLSLSFFLGLLAVALAFFFGRAAMIKAMTVVVGVPLLYFLIALVNGLLLSLILLLNVLLKRPDPEWLDGPAGFWSKLLFVVTFGCPVFGGWLLWHGEYRQAVIFVAAGGSTWVFGNILVALFSAPVRWLAYVSIRMLLWAVSFLPEDHPIRMRVTHWLENRSRILHPEAGRALGVPAGR